MVTKALLKLEIDKVQEKYLEALYQVIAAFEMPRRIVALERPLVTKEGGTTEWHDFINSTYGSLADAPITRGEPGINAEREVML